MSMLVVSSSDKEPQCERSVQESIFFFLLVLLRQKDLQLVGRDLLLIDP